MYSHLLQEHKLVLCSCTFVDFIFIPVGTQGNTLLHLLHFEHLLTISSICYCITSDRVMLALTSS